MLKVLAAALVVAAVAGKFIRRPGGSMVACLLENTVVRAMGCEAAGPIINLNPKP